MKKKNNLNFTRDESFILRISQKCFDHKIGLKKLLDFCVIQEVLKQPNYGATLNLEKRKSDEPNTYVFDFHGTCFSNDAFLSFLRF